MPDPVALVKGLLHLEEDFTTFVKRVYAECGRETGIDTLPPTARGAFDRTIPQWEQKPGTEIMRVRLLLRLKRPAKSDHFDKLGDLWDFAREMGNDDLQLKTENDYWRVAEKLGLAKRPEPVVQPEPAPETPEVVPVVDTTGWLPGRFAQCWNESVPQAPVIWRDGLLAKNWKPTFADPEFRAEFGTICYKARKIHEARGADAKWFTFTYLFTAKPGEPKAWVKLLSGYYDWMFDRSNSLVWKRGHAA